LTGMTATPNSQKAGAVGMRGKRGPRRNADNMDKKRPIMKTQAKRSSILIICVLAIVMVMPGTAFGEKDEITVGLQGGLMLPAFSPTSTTAFTLAAWTAGVYGSYGILDDLSIVASFSYFMFDGDSDNYTYSEDGLDYKGKLRCSTKGYHPEVGIRYKVYSGYNLAPYLDASIGYAWNTFNDSRLFNEDGQEYDVHISDFAQGLFTVTVGVSADYRIANMIFVGLGFKFTYAFGSDNMLEHFFTVPVQVSYYW